MRRVIISESSLQDLKKNATLLPEFLAVNAMSHETSLGDNGALPDFGDRTCEYILLKKRYSDIMDMLEQFGYAEMSDDEKQNTLNSLVAECKELEKPVRPFLEKLCFNAVNRLFSIPKEAVIIQTKLVDMVKPSGAIITPEGDDDYPSYTFDDISDMKFSHNAVLKRRFVNALIHGAAYTYSNMHDVYWDELVKVNKDFPYYYNRINVLNDYLTFATKEKISEDQLMQGSYVNVTVGDGGQKPVIESQAIIFPLLLRETIRGLFEMFSMHGLPKDKEKAEYIVKKADFILAEPWDIRLGIPMWERISERFEHTTLVPYIFMNMVSMENDEFNDSMQNILARTNKGEEILNGLVDNSIEDMRYADFKEKMKDYDTDSVLLQDSYFSADDLGTLELDADDDNVIEEDDGDEGQKQDVISLAVSNYGTTWNIREAGYILPDGRLLNFGHEGVRDVDHRGIEGIYLHNNIEIWDDTYRYNYVVDFMNHGAIRCDVNMGLLDMTNEPTKEQYAVLLRFVKMAGDVDIDFTDNRGNVEHSVSYSDANPRRVVADISRYYNEGIKPVGDNSL